MKTQMGLAFACSPINSVYRSLILFFVCFQSFINFYIFTTVFNWNLFLCEVFLKTCVTYENEILWNDFEWITSCTRFENPGIRFIRFSSIFGDPKKYSFECFIAFKWTTFTGRVLFLSFRVLCLFWDFLNISKNIREELL